MFTQCNRIQLGMPTVPKSERQWSVDGGRRRLGWAGLGGQAQGLLLPEIEVDGGVGAGSDKEGKGTA